MNKLASTSTLQLHRTSGIWCTASICFSVCHLAQMPFVNCHMTVYKYSADSLILSSPRPSSEKPNLACSTSMNRLTSLLLHLAAGASANFELFWFPNGDAQSSVPSCSKIGFACVPPSICAYDASLDRTYCCGVGLDQTCWNVDSDCDERDRIVCGQGTGACCLRSRSVLNITA